MEIITKLNLKERNTLLGWLKMPNGGKRIRHGLIIEAVENGGILMRIELNSRLSKRIDNIDFLRQLEKEKGGETIDE